MHTPALSAPTHSQGYTSKAAVVCCCPLHTFSVSSRVFCFFSCKWSQYTKQV